ncbi:ABC transporter ATP-binding protein [Kribbella deserti]|uniref:ABC transporter ATP-binding protein n=1 Tax=Kribbella deserti TaxID=1926257 RepID=A0ABV6QT68_9ACTN
MTVKVLGLTATAGDVVLVDDVSFEVTPGRITALVGASGSGKTTSALALLGEAGPGVSLRGSVEVGGVQVVDANGPTAAAAKVLGRVVAYMPQHPGSALNPARRIGAGLSELARLHAGDVAEAMRAAQLPGDRPVLRRFPHQFSGGQRQRIALAQALVCGPDVLVLDEPSTGLDSVTRWQLVGELAELAERGLGILLLSHDLDLVRALADEVVVLAEGKVQRSGTAASVLPPHAALDPDWARPALEPVLTVTGLNAALRRRGRSPVLQGIDLELAGGDCLGVVGRSGSGKTTLARCLAGLHERYDGRLTLSGDDLPVLRKRSAEQVRRVQYVWQEVRGSFDDRRPILEQVARTAIRLRGLSPEKARAEAVELLAQLGVNESIARRTPGLLSGGELQRSALARALLAGPDVLICDEITTALDEEGTRKVLDVLGRLKADGMALLWISHDLGLVAAVADHLLVLADGRVVERGDPATVLAEPADPETQRLLAAARVGREPFRAA